MKKKLFAVAMVVLLYSLLVVVFTVADNRGVISQALSDIGLSNDTAIASPTSSQVQLLESNGSLIDPLPEPTRPRPKPQS